jgi:hypothetical protein
MNIKHSPDGTPEMYLQEQQQQQQQCTVGSVDLLLPAGMTQCSHQVARHAVQLTESFTQKHVPPQSGLRRPNQLG